MLAKAFRNFMIKRTISAKLRNTGMNTFSNHEILLGIRKSSEKKRKEENRPHEVLYFHKVDDPYSHLTIHYVEKLLSNFDISLRPILVGKENSEAIHEPSLYSIYCLDDAKRIAPYYGIDFLPETYPHQSLVDLSNSILTAVDGSSFFEVAKTVSEALWRGDENTLNKLSQKYYSTKLDVFQNLKDGNSKRDDKGYYFGSAFYYEKEIYWGVDRIHHLEDRLAELGAKTGLINEPICVPSLKSPVSLHSDRKVNLYYYPSLNSPYTYVSVKRVRELKSNYPVNLITRPVLPMLMRNMTIPQYKAKYIISDAAREGRKNDYPMGDIYSPIGKPARKAYSLFPAIDEAGKGFEYIDKLLRASFYEGVNIGEDEYLQSLVESLNLDWSLIKKNLNSRKWKEVLDKNLQDMYAGNCWGVPSFKITDQNGGNPFYLWGQDRMWLLNEEIYKRLGQRDD